RWTSQPKRRSLDQRSRFPVTDVERFAMSIFDLDKYTDAVSDAVDAIGDAGDLIGGILKSVSPLLGMVPGIGTAFSVAVYAAGAIAAKDSITDAMIGT